MGLLEAAVVAVAMAVSVLVVAAAVAKADTAGFVVQKLVAVLSAVVAIFVV